MASSTLSPQFIDQMAETLKPYIQESWAELYADQSDEQQILLVLVVGEPLRRKLKLKMDELTQNLAKCLQGSSPQKRVSFFLTSPERANTDTDIRRVTLERNCLRRW